MFDRSCQDVILLIDESVELCDAQLWQRFPAEFLSAERKFSTDARPECSDNSAPPISGLRLEPSREGKSSLLLRKPGSLHRRDGRVVSSVSTQRANLHPPH